MYFLCKINRQSDLVILTPKREIAQKRERNHEKRVSSVHVIALSNLHGIRHFRIRRPQQPSTIFPAALRTVRLHAPRVSGVSAPQQFTDSVSTERLPQMWLKRLSSIKARHQSLTTCPACRGRYRLEKLFRPNAPDPPREAGESYWRSFVRRRRRPCPSASSRSPF